MAKYGFTGAKPTQSSSANTGVFGVNDVVELLGKGKFKLQKVSAEWFAAAGGGGAGGNEPRNLPKTKPGGGGGAGGLLSNNDSGLQLASFTPGQTYAIVTGSGGGGGDGYDQTGDFGITGSKGGNSTFNDDNNGTLTLEGGGAGGGGGNQGTNGGSGGGAGGGAFSSGNEGDASALTPSQGNDGTYANGYFKSGAGGGKGGSPSTQSTTSGAGFDWVNGTTYAQGGRGSDRDNSVNGTGPTSGGTGTGNGGPSRYNSHVAGLSGGSGVVGIKFSDGYTLSNPGGGLTISSSSAGGYTTALITGTGNIQFD